MATAGGDEFNVTDDADGAPDGQRRRLRDRHAPTLPTSRLAADGLDHTGDAAVADSVVDRSQPIPSIASGALAEAVEAGQAVSTPTAVRVHRIRRRVARGVALVGLAGVCYLLVCLAQVWSVGRADDRDPVDAIVVMGAAQYDGRPSPQLAARLDHVLELWPGDVAPLVVVTGGNIPGDRFTEAEASAEYLIERGIPASALVLETEGSNSYESLDSVANMLEVRGVDDIVIVTDPYHSLRSRLIAEELGLNATVSSTDTSVVTGFDSLSRHVKEAGGIAVGRVIGFERLTDIVG